MTSAIEDIEPKFSLAEVAKVDKAAHAIRVEKEKANANIIARQKHKDMQAEVERRTKVFESHKARNLEE